MVKILGLPFDDYVDKQVNIRQSKLAKTAKSPEDLTVFNSNTAWVRLSSGVTIDAARAAVLSTKLGITQEQVTGTSLPRNLILWNGVSNLDKAEGVFGGIGYGLNNAYGFLTTTDQGLKPLPGITGITSTYKNNGSLKQAQVSIKCHSRSQFEAIEAVYLRLGYTMVLEWGNTLWFDNEGQHQRTAAHSIPNLLFNTAGDVKPATLQNQILKNKKDTACNYDAMLAKVANYSWQLNEDLSFDIRLDLISLGDIIDSLKANIGGTNSEDMTKNIAVSGSAKNIAAILINKEASAINALFYELYDEVFKDLIVQYAPPDTKAAVEKAELAVKDAPKVDTIKQTYKPIIEALKAPLALYAEAEAIFKRGKAEDGWFSSFAFTPKTDADKARFEAIAKQLMPILKDPYTNLAKAFFEEWVQTSVVTFKTSLGDVEKAINGIQATGDQADPTLNFLLDAKDKFKVIETAITTGAYDDDGKIKIPGSDIKNKYVKLETLLTAIIFDKAN